MKINFNDEHTFTALEEDAIDGTLNYDRFPSVEYKYFSLLSKLGYMNRHHGWSKEICEEKMRELKRQYVREKDDRNWSFEIAGQQQDNIIRSELLRSAVNKTPFPDEKLSLALEAIERCTGEQGFAKRNTDGVIYNYRIDNDAEYRSQRDLLEGNLCRICVSDDTDEIINHACLAFSAIMCLSRYRIKKLRESDNDD